MAATITLSGDWLQSVGSEFVTSGTLTLGTYATGGVQVTPAMVGLGSFIGAPVFSAPGYAFSWDAANNKVLAYVSAGFTPAGTNGTSAVTGNVTVVGGGIGEAIGINPDTNAGTLSKAAATNRTIPIATFLGAAPTAAAQTFTGTAVAAGALVEVANGVSLAAVTVQFRAFGAA